MLNGELLKGMFVISSCSTAFLWHALPTAKFWLLRNKVQITAKIDTGPRVSSAQHPYFKLGSWRGLHMQLGKAQIFKPSVCRRAPVVHSCPVTWNAELSIRESLLFKSRLIANTRFIENQAKLKKCKYWPRRNECLQFIMQLAHADKVCISSAYKNCTDLSVSI